MDDCDRAQQINEQFQQAALAAHVRRGIRNSGRIAVGECVECGNDIPEGRRLAVPDCIRCVSCQQVFEIHGRA